MHPRSLRKRGKGLHRPQADVLASRCAPHPSPSPKGRRVFGISIENGLGLALLCVAGASPAAATDPAWLYLTTENNNFVVDQDQHYVNGLNLSYLSPSFSTDRSWVARGALAIEKGLPLLFPAAQAECDRRFEWTALGQQIFTPADKSAPIPDPLDRPYAAWLYTGFNLLQNRNYSELDDLSATIGIVGPAALGDEVMNSFHETFGFGQAAGWSHQLKNEPALTIAYLRKWRFAAGDIASGGFNADVVPELGAMAGNVLTYGEATMLARVGWGLDASFGPRLIQPGVSAGGYLNAAALHRNWSAYIFAGVQQRVVAHNIFLDGNSYQSSPAVGKYIWVHDQVIGLSALGWRSLRIDLTYVRRSDEFHGQNGSDRYGSITLATAW